MTNMKIINKEMSLFQNSVSFRKGFRKSSLKPAFSTKSKEAVPKTEVLEQSRFSNKFALVWFAVKFLVLFSFSAPLYAQAANPYWLSLELGKQRFRAGDYGAALMLFEDARRSRRTKYEQMERDVISFLSLREVRRIGDSLDWVVQFANARHFTAASAAFEGLFHRIPKAAFGNSAERALEAFEKLKNYPEAEFWIGEVFRVEGALQMALDQYNRALEMRDVLEDPGFVITLQYNIANIHRIRQEFVQMERTLETIINEHNTLWSDTARPAAGNITHEAALSRQAMVNMLQNDGVNRFLEIFRYNNQTVEPAHRQLGFHAVLTGRGSAVPHLMFAFLIQNTIIIEEVRRRQFDFTFRDLPSLMAAVNNNPLILSYIEEVEYFKTIYHLGAALFRVRPAVARDLWLFLAGQPQAGEWHSRAVRQLQNPQAHPIVESPW